MFDFDSACQRPKYVELHLKLCSMTKLDIFYLNFP